MAAMNFRPEDVRLAGGSARAWSEELIPRVREALAALPQAAVGHTRATLSLRNELAALQGLVALAERAEPFRTPYTISGTTPLEALPGSESPARNNTKAGSIQAVQALDELPSGSGRDICPVSVPRATAVPAEADTNDHNRHVGTRRATTQPRHFDWEARCAESSL
jgi:hypothetical protein